ncbi:MAG: efflux RND transporter periplasmic adaptor subunit [Pseudomonadota bacterium]
MNLKHISLKYVLLIFCATYVSYSAAEDDVDLFLNNDSIASQNVRGLIKPIKTAVISSQLSAKIDKIPFGSGDRFKKGDTLVDFDCALYRADLTSTEAAFQAKKNVFENKKELLALNAMSDIDVDIAKSEMEVARAERSMSAIKVNQCLIKAPYDGRVIEVSVNEHENVNSDTELLAILNDNEIEIELIIPSTWLTWLTTGENFQFMIDETGETVEAAVSKIGAVVDPVSQTIKLTGEFKEQPERVLSGMSGTAQFKQ